MPEEIAQKCSHERKTGFSLMKFFSLVFFNIFIILEVYFEINNTDGL